MLDVHRSAGNIWLDLDSLYPPKYAHPNTVFKSFAIAFAAIGSGITYDILMGMSGSAFRIQLHENWCPSSPHPCCGINCTEIVKLALKLDTLSHEHAYEHEHVDTIVQAVTSAIDRGIPVIAYSYETGLIAGYGAGKEGTVFLYREPYSNEGDAWEEINPQLQRNQLFGYAIFESPPSEPDKSAIIESLERAIRLPEIPEFDNYMLGDAAYAKWIAELRDESAIERLRENWSLQELSNHNAHILYSLLDARQSAAGYLRYVTKRLGEVYCGYLEQAADLYDRMTVLLRDGMDTVLWDWKIEQGADWTDYMRIRQADMLEQAASLDHEALQRIHEALQRIG